MAPECQQSGLPGPFCFYNKFSSSTMNSLRRIALGALFVFLLSAAETGSSTQQQIQAHAVAAQQALRAGQAGTAIREYQEILRIDPKNLDALANLGTAFFFTGDYVKAVPMLRAA